MSKHKFYEGIWTIQHVREGKVIWEEVKKNALVDEGEQLIADTFFRALNTPASFWLRLYNGSFTEASTLATASTFEMVIANGYTAMNVERSVVGFPTLEQHDGDWRVVSKEVIFTASGGQIGPLNTAILATSVGNTGKLLAYMALSVSRTLVDGDSLLVTFYIKFK